MLNVIIHDYESSCYICNEPTRHFVFEYEKDLCMSCIMALSAVIVMVEEIEKDYHNADCN